MPSINRSPSLLLVERCGISSCQCISSGPNVIVPPLLVEYAKTGKRALALPNCERHHTDHDQVIESGQCRLARTMEPLTFVG